MVEERKQEVMTAVKSTPEVDVEKASRETAGMLEGVEGEIAEVVAQAMALESLSKEVTKRICTIDQSILQLHGSQARHSNSTSTPSTTTSTTASSTASNIRRWNSKGVMWVVTLVILVMCILLSMYF